MTSDKAVTVTAGNAPCEFILMQGRPINEPVSQYGPFVMNTQQEIQDAFDDYRRTQFGGCLGRRVSQCMNKQIPPLLATVTGMMSKRYTKYLRPVNRTSKLITCIHLLVSICYF
ncbi:pirin-like C-terminal cupin domain-containing protein [Paraglaciecola sp.]|uniref:pirin-like C-terminal cupin domain-containing protein n=1 Tax=Paraglaciecola sp. TaxID=1920173 RepID=UPI0030F3B327